MTFLGGRGGGGVLAFLLFLCFSFPALHSLFWTFPVQSPLDKSKNIRKRHMTLIKNLLMSPFLMGCFQGHFREGKLPIKEFGVTAHQGP